MSEHVLDLVGTGHFSRGKCTGCGWAMNGHAEEIQRVWERYHESDAVVLPVPARAPLPPVPEDPVVAAIERRIIEVLTTRVDFNNQSALFVAWGHAEARAMLLQEPARNAVTFVSDLMARIASLSKRQREKLRHPTRTREEQQRILEAG
jgi:hypothetical protein